MELREIEAEEKERVLKRDLEIQLQRERLHYEEKIEKLAKAN